MMNETEEIHRRVCAVYGVRFSVGTWVLLVRN